jgi:phosphoglycerate dehydrogenase-like enzyme
VTVHLKMSDRSRGIIGEDELRALGPDGYLVNTSRGPIVDEAALVAALYGSTIAGAGLDVFDTEPLPLDHPHRTAPNTVLTPHIGFVSQQSCASHTLRGVGTHCGRCVSAPDGVCAPQTWR